MTENEDTRGLSQRELLLEVRSDVKRIHFDLSSKVGRTEMYSALGLVVTVIAGAVFAFA